MIDLGKAAEDLLGNHMSWIRLVAWLLGAAMLVSLGWAAHEAFDGTSVAKSETQTAQAQLRCESARADLNEASASALAKSGQGAAAATGTPMPLRTRAKAATAPRKKEHLMPSPHRRLPPRRPGRMSRRPPGQGPVRSVR